MTFLTAALALGVWAAPSSMADDLIDSNKVSRAEIERLAATTLPHARQMAWHRDEYIAFVHFGVNTFTAREWGTGFEDPQIFDPTELDTDQWCEAMVAAGMKKVIFTAKHHDGFCLWPSRYTDHSVASSPWKDGQGDVVKELAESCRKYGLTMGIYLSPADLFQIESEGGYYGNLSEYNERVIPRPVEGRPFDDKRTFEFVVDDYNEYFLNQLFELLTEYGPVHEVWFDGAKPKDKGGQQYTYQAWYSLIRELAPEAVIFGKGPDIRWCGNEAGRTRNTEWNVIPILGSEEDHTWPDLTAQDIASTDALVDGLRGGGTLRYHPAETNTSIRHGWFWRDEEQYVKTADEIEDIWYRSVGGNSVFLLNIPPNRKGLFPDRDVAVLKEVGRRLEQAFETDLTEGATATASSTADWSDPRAVLDGTDTTGWQPDEETGWLVVELPEVRAFNRIVIQENIADFSQRIARFAVDVWVDDDWEVVRTGTTVGYKKILRTESYRSDKIRIRIFESRLEPTISEVGLFMALEAPKMPSISRDASGVVTITGGSHQVVHYTLDGSDPTESSSVYDSGVALPDGGVVKARAIDSRTGFSSDVTTVTFGLSQAGWTLRSASSIEPGEGGERAFDGDPSTFWHSKYSGGNDPQPHTLEIDLGSVKSLTGFTYLPRQDGQINGTIRRYSFAVSADGQSWTTVIENQEFGNIRNNPLNQTVRFESAQRARYVRLISLEEVNGQPWASAAEIGLLVH